MNIFRKIRRWLFGRKTRPVTTMTGFYGCDFNDGTEPELNRESRETELARKIH